MSLEKRVLGKNIPNHIAIILDGNGRWANKRGLPRTMGHKKGAENLRNTAISCSKLGIKALSVYAFSTENWNRPKDEVEYLMALPQEFEKTYKDDFKNNNIRVIFSGRKDRFSPVNLELIQRIETKTKDRTGMILNVCFDYGSQTEIISAMKEIASLYKEDKIKLDDIDVDLVNSHLYTKELPPLDLLIRTSGEQRISNFLLWQIAYSEFYFAKKNWPAFSKKELLKALNNFQNRNRRFGGLKVKK